MILSSANMADESGTARPNAIENTRNEKGQTEENSLQPVPVSSRRIGH
jgi:hypothetical protein